MSAQQDALLQAVLDDPDDDTVRLVFADWCEEHGHADRAEFIRLQIERARLAPYHPRHAVLAQRETALLQEHAAEWFASPAGWAVDGFPQFEVHRGFPRAVTCGYQEVITHLATLARWPVTRLAPYLNTPEQARLLAGVPLLARVRELDLRHQYPGAEGLRTLLTSPLL